MPGVQDIPGKSLKVGLCDFSWSGIARDTKILRVLKLGVVDICVC